MTLFDSDSGERLEMWGKRVGNDNANGLWLNQTPTAQGTRGVHSNQSAVGSPLLILFNVQKTLMF